MAPDDSNRHIERRKSQWSKHLINNKFIIIIYKECILGSKNKIHPHVRQSSVVFGTKKPTALNSLSSDTSIKKEGMKNERKFDKTRNIEEKKENEITL